MSEVHWQVFSFRDGSFSPVGLPCGQHCSFDWPDTSVAQAPEKLIDQRTWRVTASSLADVTGDGLVEWALVVWRPWRDWPIQRWSPAPSPIVAFHDAVGDSCHLILLDPHDGHEIWAGSALPAPILALAVGDVNGDGHSEVVTLEGEYANGRNGPATHVDVWKWNSFGFTLEWRSPGGVFRQLRLIRVTDDSILDIVASDL
jgi:hypothetical protein